MHPDTECVSFHDISPHRFIRFATLLILLATVAGPARSATSLPTLADIEPTIRFGMGVHYPVEYELQSCAASDLDGANGPDLVSANSAAIQVLPNLGGGTFGSEVDIPMGGVLSSFAVADLDGDGRPDLIAAASDSAGPMISVRRGLSGLQFDLPVIVRQPALASVLAIADIDGDGRPDLLTASEDDDSLR